MKKLHEISHRLHNADLAILFVRIALGVAFIYAGWGKIQNIDFVVQMFGSLGIPAFLAYFVSYVELIGGFLVLIGIFVRYTSFFLSAIMIVAILKVHLPNGFGLQNNGYEFVFILLCLSLAMITYGSGNYSLAGYLRMRKALRS